MSKKKTRALRDVCDHLTHVSFSAVHPDFKGTASFMWCPQCGSLGVPAKQADNGIFHPEYFKHRQVEEFTVGKVTIKDYWFWPGYDKKFHPNVDTD